MWINWKKTPFALDLYTKSCFWTIMGLTIFFQTGIVSEPYTRAQQFWCQKLRDTWKKKVMKRRGQSLTCCENIARNVEDGGPKKPFRKEHSVPQCFQCVHTVTMLKHSNLTVWRWFHTVVSFFTECSHSDVLFQTVNWWFTVSKRSNLTLWRDFTLFSQCVHTVFHTVFFPAGKCPPPPIGIRVKPSNLNNMVCSFWWSSRATQIDLSLHTCIFIWHCVFGSPKS